MEETGLDKLKAGEGGHVQAILGAGRLGRRMTEMGLTPGTKVRVSRRAPLGDPLEIALRGYALTLRKADAGLVRVIRFEDKGL